MTEKDRRVSSAVFLGDGLLLLCAAAGLAGSFLSLYGDAAARDTVLDRCAADLGWFMGWAVFFALTSLCAWSLPRFRETAAGGLAALCGLSVWWKWDEVLSGAALTCKTIADLFASRVDWGRTFAYETQRTLAQAASDVRLFLLLALVLLTLALGWVVVRARRWWLAVLLTLPPLLPGLLADLYPSWPAFMALSACWCAMLLTGLCKWAAPSGRGRLTLAVLPGVALVLAGVTLLFPRAGYTRPQWALRAETGLHDASNRLTDFFSRWDGPFGGSAVTYVGAAEETDLSAAGPLNYTGRTVLRVTSDYDGRLYLRGSSLAVYDGGVWRALPEGIYQEEYLDRLDGSDGPSPLVFPAGRYDRRATSAVTVDNVGAVGSCVYAPYFLTDQDWQGRGMLPVEDVCFAYRQGQRDFTMDFSPPEVVGLYFWEDPVMSVYRDYVYDHYLDVPEGLRDELEIVIRMGWSVGVLGDSYMSTPIFSGDHAVQYAQQLGGFIGTFCEYDVNTPAAPEGEDPVLWFLTEGRRGYCMHYASAVTLLLRQMGIPARYVSGFTAECVPDRQVDVPDRAAHAWVEVWLDGFGWYPVDVTPAAAFEWYEQGSAGPEEEPSELPIESEKPEPTPAPSEPEPGESLPAGETDDPVLPGDGESGPAFTIPPWAKWAAMALGALALLWLGQFIPKGVRDWRMSCPDRDRAALNCYGYLRRMERWGGRVSARALELAEKAKFSQHTVTQAELDELRLLVDWERTRLCVVLGPAARLACRYWWGMPKPPSALRRVPPLGKWE